jgi:hypothetical protein
VRRVKESVMEVTRDGLTTKVVHDDGSINISTHSSEEAAIAFEALAPPPPEADPASRNTGGEVGDDVGKESDDAKAKGKAKK